MKRAGENSKQVLALHKSAEEIEKMAGESKKRTKLAKEMVNIDRQKYMVALLSMLDTNPELKETLIRLSQMKTIHDLQRQLDPAMPTVRKKNHEHGTGGIVEGGSTEVSEDKNDGFQDDLYEQNSTETEERNNKTFINTVLN